MKILLTLFILFISSSLYSKENWVYFGFADNGTTETTMYVDYNQVDKRNGYLIVVTLFDFSPKIEGAIGSLKFLTKYDCGDAKSKLLRTIYYDGQMGEGDVYGDNTENESWEYLIPNSNEYALLETLCLKF